MRCQPRPKGLFEEVTSCGRDRSGGMAVTMAFFVMAALGIAALAIDGAGAISAHTRLDLSADASALVALRAAAAAYNLDPKTDFNDAEVAGVQRFTAQAGGITGVSVPAVAVHVQRDGLRFSATVTYVATYMTQIAGALNGVFGGYTSVPSLPLGGTAQAQEQAGAFVDIQVLMDVSNSMAIGATELARSDLQTKTTQYPITGGYDWRNCAFACHMSQPLQSGLNQQFGDYYLMARFFGILLRIDVLKSAVSYVASILATARYPEKFRFGLYTFETAVHEVYPLGSPAGAAPAIATTEVTPIADWGPWNQTNVAQSITTFGDYVDPAGDGTSVATARKYVFILTDGMEDFTGNNGQRVVVPFDPSVCQALKDKGVIILILQTTNDDPTDQIGENSLLAEVRPLLQQCASGPDLFTSASTPAEINAAIRTMVNYAVSTPAQFTQ